MSIYVDIEKEYRGFRLSVKFDIKENVLSLLGASGSGKSLTLKCIAGIEKPDSGQIILNGVTVFDSAKNINLPPQKRRVGFLFQNYSLFPNMSVRDNIGYVSKKPKKERDELIGELLQSLHLEPIANSYPRQISGGQQQRVAMARILASEPAVFLLDEPFSALDSHLRWSMERDLSGILKEQGKSAVFVSHDYDEAYRVCDRVAVIHQGVIVDMGDKNAVFHHPQTLSSALITGCKNISRAEKAAPFSVAAPDWGVNLRTDREVTDGVKHVGVHSHSLQFSNGSNRLDNQFSCRIQQVIEDPHKNQLLLSFCPSSPNGASCQNGEKTICLETSADHTFQTGQIISIHIPPQSVTLFEK